MARRTAGTTGRPPDIERLGEDGVLVRLGTAIDPRINARVHALARHLAASRPDWVRDIVPAYASLAVFVDPGKLPRASDPLDAAITWVQAQPVDAMADTAIQNVIEIPVRYGGEDGPDLADVATHAGLDPVDVITRHAAIDYTVAMLGFAPGFPYLLGLDPSLAMQRLHTPRLRVPAGSVGIGGAQTGIYPRPGPGGWRIIGCTDVALFDPRHSPPSLLSAGDRVRFVAVGSA